jgi:hypothetical protein
MLSLLLRSCAQGYGVSYSVAGEDEFVFHVSASVKAAPKTGAKRFTCHIVQALADMRDVLSQALGDEAAAKAAVPHPPSLADAAPRDEGGTGGTPTASSSAAAAAFPAPTAAAGDAPPPPERAPLTAPAAEGASPALATPQPLMLSASS